MLIDASGGVAERFHLPVSNRVDPMSNFHIASRLRILIDNEPLLSKLVLIASLSR